MDYIELTLGLDYNLVLKTKPYLFKEKRFCEIGGLRTLADSHHLSKNSPIHNQDFAFLDLRSMSEKRIS